MNMNTIFSISPLDWYSIFTVLFCSIIIGLERQLRGKPVGIRTAAMISLGTYLFIAAAMATRLDQSDPLRIVGQVVTGIGFLGAGVIMKQNGIVVGVTSAATIWALASISVLIALGHRITAIKLSILVVAILYGIDLLERSSRLLRKGVHRKKNVKHNVVCEEE